MPLRPIPTYDSWSLACILSWRDAETQRPEDEDQAMQDELRKRGKTEADLAEMVELASQVGRWLNPPGVEFKYVYLGIEDLFLGIDRALGQGLIDEAERDRLWEILRRHWVNPADQGRA